MASHVFVICHRIVLPKIKQELNADQLIAITVSCAAGMQIVLYKITNQRLVVQGDDRQQTYVPSSVGDISQPSQTTGTRHTHYPLG